MMRMIVVNNASLEGLIRSPMPLNRVRLLGLQLLLLRDTSDGSPSALLVVISLPQQLQLQLLSPSKHEEVLCWVWAVVVQVEVANMFGCVHLESIGPIWTRGLSRRRLLRWVRWRSLTVHLAKSIKEAREKEGLIISFGFRNKYKQVTIASRCNLYANRIMSWINVLCVINNWDANELCAWNWSDPSHIPHVSHSSISSSIARSSVLHTHTPWLNFLINNFINPPATHTEYRPQPTNGANSLMLGAHTQHYQIATPEEGVSGCIKYSSESFNYRTDTHLTSTWTRNWITIIIIHLFLWINYHASNETGSCCHEAKIFQKYWESV